MIPQDLLDLNINDRVLGAYLAERYAPEATKYGSYHIMIMSCTCKHDQQDKLHGNGRRVHNLMGLNGENGRCTVCSKTKSVPGKGGYALAHLVK